MMTTLGTASTTAFPGEIELRFPYAADLVDALKEAIPLRHRRWDPDEKRWLITDPHTQTAINLLVAHFPNAEIPAGYARSAAVKVVSRTPRRKSIALLAHDPEHREFLPVLERADQLMAFITCPRCHIPYQQPIRVTAESSARAAKREITPEMISVCASCGNLLVLVFQPIAVGTMCGAEPA
jgi:hypothetical protein